LSEVQHTVGQSGMITLFKYKYFLYWNHG